MGRKRKQVSGVSANAAAIISAKGWRVSVFNGGTHLRINGVVDVWPTRRRANAARRKAEKEGKE